MIDFGLSKRIKSKFNKVSPEEYTTNISGTAQGKPSSERDDLISAGYMLYYIYHGSLPWASACAIKTPGRH
ncbi:Casein kinase 1-like protein 3 [Armadillidium nasatum]|uniref:Casein kinase 1-like protein 3 n=1 Tax=Armadillidium nasatum TaxID=96803 RepID=A0A5N5SUQ8_9CRUS|nr:Casein kinase 1-like protein 3 [Armadillidium nasatum]